MGTTQLSVLKVKQRVQEMISVVTLLSILKIISAYSNGAPGYKNVCVDMEPGHRVPHQPLSTFPLSLKNKENLRSRNYNDKGFVTFKIEGKFKGAIFQVRDENDKVVGEFCEKSLPSSMKFVGCSKYGISGKATVSHDSAAMKNELVLVWKSGGQNFGKVKLYASVVQSYAKVWVKKSMVAVDF